MNSDGDNPEGLGCPIRISTDQCLLAAPHGFSQPTTSFIASMRQGIHQMPFSYLDRLKKCPATHSGKHRGPWDGTQLNAEHKHMARPAKTSAGRHFPIHSVQEHRVPGQAPEPKLLLSRPLSDVRCRMTDVGSIIGPTRFHTTDGPSAPLTSDI